MLYYRDKYIAKLYYGTTQIKEMWLGNKKFYGPQTKDLLSSTEDIPFGYYLENFCIKNTQGEIISDDVQEAMASYSDTGPVYRSSIFFIRNGELVHHSVEVVPSPSEVRVKYIYTSKESEGWSHIIWVDVFGSGRQKYGVCLGIKERKACLFIERGGEYMTNENVVKVSFAPLAWDFDNVYASALTYDGKVLFCCSSLTGTNEWVNYRQGAVDISDAAYLNANNEWRSIETDELVNLTTE